MDSIKKNVERLRNLRKIKERNSKNNLTISVFKKLPQNQQKASKICYFDTKSNRNRRADSGLSDWDPTSSFELNSPHLISS